MPALLLSLDFLACYVSIPSGLQQSIPPQRFLPLPYNFPQLPTPRRVSVMVTNMNQLLQVILGGSCRKGLAMKAHHEGLAFILYLAALGWRPGYLGPVVQGTAVIGRTMSFTEPIAK